MNTRKDGRGHNRPGPAGPEPAPSGTGKRTAPYGNRRSGVLGTFAADAPGAVPSIPWRVLKTPYFYISLFIEDPMKISDLVLEMELNGVDEADIAEIVTLCHAKGLNSEMIDEELVKRGYEKIFTVDYDGYEGYDDWEDDEYSTIEKFPHKQHYRE